jgi:glycerophosphoryl diester phosphodiesterase
MLANLRFRFFAGLGWRPFLPLRRDHRPPGCFGRCSENSLLSMKTAWEQGADAVELDLWLSKDGKLIVFHDSTRSESRGQSKITD